MHTRNGKYFTDENYSTRLISYFWSVFEDELFSYAIGMFQTKYLVTQKQKIFYRLNNDFFSCCYD